MILKQSSPNFTFLTRSIDSFLKCPEILFCHVSKIASGHFPKLTPPMALDSKVAFQARTSELGVSQVNVDALEAKGITSYATYAYCCTFQPGQVDDSALKDFLNDALGAAPDSASMSPYRRLFFEAHALSLEDLKSRVHRSESSEARVIPLPEKLDRIRLQKERLVGISFTPSVEPSHSLIDRACQQL